MATIITTLPVVSSLDEAREAHARLDAEQASPAFAPTFWRHTSGLVFAVGADGECREALVREDMGGGLYLVAVA